MINMLISHHVGRSIAVSLDPGRDLFVYDYSSAPKPFFHPLNTPGGHLLTNFQPKDHVWHRGLWFTIKYVNGKNYWEENDEFGAQVTLLAPTISHPSAGAVEIASDLEWRHPQEPTPVITEHRVLGIAMVDDSTYAIDFDTTLTAQADLLLDRTPFTTWGGYGGLTIRGSRSWINSKILISDGAETDRPTGIPGNWAQLYGDLDGDTDLTAGVAMLDHPQNPRHPSPWYGATGGGLYLNPAFLFHEPMTVESGKQLRFRYRVLVYDGIKNAAYLNRAWEDYAR